MTNGPPDRARRIALAGNPNVGKTTLFNALTGLRQKVGNYAGVTVERKSGPLLGAEGVEVVDLPGTYSLTPRSRDERVAFDVLTGRMPGEPAPDLVVCVVDATNLERNLYLTSQVLDLGLPAVVALNQMDAAHAQGLVVDVLGLSTALGVPVVPISARRGEGLDLLREALHAPLAAPAPLAWPLMPAVEAPVAHLADALHEPLPEAPPARRRLEALGALTSDVLLEPWAARDVAFHGQVLSARTALDEAKAPYRQAEMMGRYGFLAPLAARYVTRHAEADEATASDRLDAVLTHRVAGPLIFAGLLIVVFQAVFTWATPAMDAIEALVAWAGEGLRAVLPAGFVADLVVDGALTGVGNVLVFLPQILLLFFFLGLMEDTGYMARSAFLMDRLMRKLGLSGGSVVPLLSSYACAIPGIMAARTLASERDRLITILVAPLMACSARLPVYTLFIGAFIPDLRVAGLGLQGLTMFGLYALGTVMAFVAAFVLSRTAFKGQSSFFVMELPPYRAPQLKAVFFRMVDRAKAFFLRAGKIILTVSLILWALASFPRPPEGASPSEAVERSVVGRLGHALEPIMRPLGFDWKISAAVVTSFAAREVIVSSLATIYAADDTGEDTPVLRDRLRADRHPDGSPVFSPLVALSLLVFYVFALQCMSTLAIARRETNSWRWPVVMWAYMMALAYGFSFVVYQGGQLLGFG